MSSRLAYADAVTPAAPQGTLTVALAGNPNSGKTTIFNALTGLRQHVANYPGVTVEKKTGRCKLPGGSWADVIDLPGTYSLISRSPDEQVAMEVLRGLRKDTAAPDVVIVIVDASNLQRNLYLVSQLIELGRPLVVALNMIDVAERRGMRVSAEQLSAELGVPVVAVVGHKRKGIHELKEAISRATPARTPDWPLPPAMRDELKTVGSGLAELDGPTADESAGRPLQRYQLLAERLLTGDRAGDLAHLASQPPVSSLLDGATNRLAALGIDPMQADIEAHYRWIDDVAGRVVTPLEPDRGGRASGPIALNVLGRSSGAASAADDAADAGLAAAATPRPLGAQPSRTAADRTLTERVDAVLVHKVWGLLIFAAVMAALFFTIFWVADPMMGAVEGFIGWLGELVTGPLSDGPLKDLLTDGVFAGVGAVVVFVPQIALLFLFLAVLEDSGYLARAAFLMDRLLSKVGLHGKSFIPLLSSFACAIPGVMAARTIENRKDRLATIFVAPFMSCSARLPVYFLLIGTLFSNESLGLPEASLKGALTRAGIMLSLYLLGIVAAAGTAWVFKRSFLKGPAQAFILELPSYKVPQLSQIGRQVWTNTAKFLTKAGTTIFCLSVIIWALMYYPGASQERKVVAEREARAAFAAEADPALTAEDAAKAEKAAVKEALKSARLNASYAAMFGKAIEPVIRPLGYDWKMGVGLVGAFAAREVFVSTLAITYNAGDGEDTDTVAEAMRADTYPADHPTRAGRKVWTPVVAASMLVWFVLAMQCLSTLAIVRRETGGWRWPVLMLLYMNGLAYVAALLVYQVGSRLA